jgi:hypothetical protein
MRIGMLLLPFFPLALGMEIGADDVSRLYYLNNAAATFYGLSIRMTIMRTRKDLRLRRYEEWNAILYKEKLGTAWQTKLECWQRTMG